jgi:hypothetical protein
MPHPTQSDTLSPSKLSNITLNNETQDNNSLLSPLCVTITQRLHQLSLSKPQVWSSHLSQLTPLVSTALYPPTWPRVLENIRQTIRAWDIRCQCRCIPAMLYYHLGIPMPQHHLSPTPPLPLHHQTFDPLTTSSPETTY